MSHLLLFTFRKLLNTFIYTARNDPLLANAHGLFQESPTEPPQNALELTLTILGMSLDFIIRYIIGNLVMSLLILETIDSNPPNPHKDKDKDDNKKSQPKPTTRNLRQTLTTFHREKGLISLINGFHYTIYYHLRYFIVTGMLTSPIARFPEPLAHIIASVALAEFHFFRTAGAILPPAEQMRYVPLGLDYYRWNALLLPTLLYALAESIMMYVPGLLLAPVRFDGVLLLQPEDLTDVTSLVRSDILVAGLMLVAQVVVLFPAYIVLVVVEGSLVPGDCETLIPLPEEEGARDKKMGDGDDQIVLWKENEDEDEDEEYPKQQGRLVKDLFRLPGPLHVLDVVEMISVRQLLYCLELHGKMCLCVVGVATVVQSVVYLVS